MIVATVMAAGLAPMAVTGTAQAAPAASSTTSVEYTATNNEKIRAAAVLGISAGQDLLVLSDANFVIALWRKAASSSQIKTAALAAFNSTDPDACTAFIRTGIFQAKAADDALAIAAEQYRIAKIKAINSIPGMTATDAIINLNDNAFVMAIWRAAPTDSQLKAAALQAVTSGTATDLTTFITTGVYTALAADQAKEIADQAAAAQAAKELQANRDAKARAVQAVLRITATAATLDLTDRDFVDYLYTNAPGSEVKLAARIAMSSTDPAALRTFIFTGVYQANDRDVQAAQAKDIIIKTQKVQDIVDNASRDGHQPNLLAAAKAALANPTLDVLDAFLLHGAHDAAAADLTTPTEGLIVELQVKSSSRCLQVAGLWGYGAESNGAGTELWDCVQGNKQRWILHSRGSNQYQLQNVNSGKCLTASGSGEGDSLVQYDCSNETNQRWEFRTSGDFGFLELRNVATGRVATASGSGANGTFILQYTTEHADDQTWRLIDVNHTGNNLTVTPGVIELQGVQSGRCIQTAGLWDTPGQGALANNAAMELWDCVYGPKMKWTVIDLGSQKYQLRNALSDKCLDIQDGKATNGVPLVQNTCSDALIQQWLFVNGPNGTIKLQNYQTGTIATALNSGTANATLVQQFDDGNGTNQQWNIIHV